MNVEDLSTIGTSVVSGSVVGILIGYAVKKVLRIGIIILGGFFAGVTYLQYQGILSVNWDRIEGISKDAMETFNNTVVSGHMANSFLTNLGLPLTGSMAFGFAIGFMKG